MISSPARAYDPRRSEADATRVLVVDDSATIRNVVTRILNGQPDIAVVATAADGQLAVASLESTIVDVVVLDIEMPNVDGLTAIPRLLAISGAIRIVMSSSLTQSGAEATMKALSAGAADYIPKPSSVREVLTGNDFQRDLVFKVRHLGAAARRAGSRNRTAGAPGIRPRAAAAPVAAPAFALAASGAAAAPAPVAAARPAAVLRAPSLRPVQAIAIGSSTGGPNAVLAVLGHLKPPISQPIFITQHMPATFTTIFAKQIERQTGWPTVEAANGMEIQSGHVYVAPGDFHMTIAGTAGQTARLKLTQDAPENFCRPAADVMLRGLAQLYGSSLLTIILTGMGQDGLRGCDAVIAAGGTVIAQDEATSIVWGMPGAVANAGLCAAILPLDQIASRVQQLLSRQGVARAS